MEITEIKAYGYFRQFVKLVNYVKSVLILICVSYKHWICNIGGIKHEAKLLCL